MKASRFSDAQKAFILKQGTDGMLVADVCRTDVVFAVLFGLVEFWRAGRDKTPNTYVIDIACALKRQRGTGERADA